MVSFNVLLSAVSFTLLLLQAQSSSRGGSSKSYSYDLSGAALKKLYNSDVYKAEWMKRPLSGSSSMKGPLSHSGVRVTLADGSQWLIHKGNGFGRDSQTVVTDVRHMSSAWKVKETNHFYGTKTVSDFVKAGGSDYSLIFDNCHQCAGRMMNQKKKKKGH